MNSLVWKEIGERVRRSFDEVTDRVREVNPALAARAGWTTSLGYVRFIASLAFMYDPAQQEYEDLILSLTCSAADRAFWTIEGEAKMFPDAAGRDAIGFEIARGTGEVIAALEPVLLPVDKNSIQYERTVREYAEKATSFIDEHMDVVLAVLVE